MSHHSGATEILPGLWLGDITSANDKTFLNDKHIQLMMNCSNDPKFPNNSLIKIKHYLTLSDQYETSEYINVCRQIDECCVLIKDQIDVYNILIYCQTGNHHAPLVVMGYLMKYSSLNLSEIIRCLKTKRTDICDLMTNYYAILKLYQKMVKDSNKTGMK